MNRMGGVAPGADYQRVSTPLVAVMAVSWANLNLEITSIYLTFRIGFFVSSQFPIYIIPFRHTLHVDLAQQGGGNIWLRLLRDWLREREAGVYRERRTVNWWKVIALGNDLVNTDEISGYDGFPKPSAGNDAENLFFTPEQKMNYFWLEIFFCPWFYSL